MKILLVATKAGPGGVQTFLAVLARSLASRGHEVVVAAGAGEYLPGQLAGSPVQFRRLNSLSGRLGLGAVLHYIWELRHLLQDYQAEVAHFNSSHAVLGLLGLIGKKRPKIIYTVHGLSVLDSRYEAGWKRPFYLLAYYLLMARADRLVFVSRHNYREAQAQGLTRRGEVIYNGLQIADSDFLPREEARAYLSRAVGSDLSSTLLVGSVGRLSYQKNYDFLVSRWPEFQAAVPAAKLLIIGDGEDKPALEEMISRLGLTQQVFLVSAAPASLYLKAFDLFVLPSRYEGLPISLLEAMAAGCPILASDVGGNAELLRHPGELYPWNDWPLFMSAAERLLGEADWRGAAVAANLAALKDFGAEEMVSRYLDTYAS